MAKEENKTSDNNNAKDVKFIDADFSLQEKIGKNTKIKNIATIEKVEAANVVVTAPLPVSRPGLGRTGPGMESAGDAHDHHTLARSPEVDKNSGRACIRAEAPTNPRLSARLVLLSQLHTTPWNLVRSSVAMVRPVPFLFTTHTCFLPFVRTRSGRMNRAD